LAMGSFWPWLGYAYLFGEVGVSKLARGGMSLRPIMRLVRQIAPSWIRVVG
jgi:hypothetical protein